MKRTANILWRKTMSGVEKASAHIKGIVGEGVSVDSGKRLGTDGTEEEVKLWTKLLGV